MLAITSQIHVLRLMCCRLSDTDFGPRRMSLNAALTRSKHKCRTSLRHRLEGLASQRKLSPQAGQFLGARGDFVPKPICQKLSLLHDQVPPMPPAQVRASIEGELGAPLEQVFEWINLDKPLGSASISQVCITPPMLTGLPQESVPVMELPCSQSFDAVIAEASVRMRRCTKPSFLGGQRWGGAGGGAARQERLNTQRSSHQRAWQLRRLCSPRMHPRTASLQ